MKTIPVSDLIIPKDRQRGRESFTPAKLASLVDSIERLGQLQPVILENDKKTLRAGERRTESIKILVEAGKRFFHDGKKVPAGHIVYVTVGDLSEADLYEVELAENIERQDLTWQERDTAKVRLFQLRRGKAEEKGEVYTMADFNREVRGPGAPYDVGLTAAIEVVKNLHNPDVAKAKSREEAVKIIRRNNESVLREALVEKLAADVGAPKSKHTLVLGSAFDNSAIIDSNSVDVILTDPPYGIDMDTMNTQSGSSSGLTHNYKDDLEYASKCVEFVAQEGMRVTKASAHAYMFCELEHFQKWQAIFQAHGWYVWPKPVIWNKSPTGSLLGAANGPRHVYEAILYAIKGRRPVNIVGADVISVPGPSANKLHPAEKPVELLARLLSWSAVPGDRIVDFFCGCGGVFPAANQFQCEVVAFERDPAHHAHAFQRMSQMEVL